MDTEPVFTAGGFDYKIQPDYIEGDFSRVYYGERSADGNLENICLKVVKDKEDNGLMANESRVLSTLSHRSIPVYLGEITTADGRTANVLKRIEDSYDLRAVNEHFPNGIIEEHAAWIMARLLGVLGHLHTNNIIHGSIEPGNIMITPHTHNGLLIDYLLAIPEAHQDGTSYAGYNNFSAPEVGPDARPHPSSDMYSLGKSMVYLMGGDDKVMPAGLNPKIVRFIQGFLVADPSHRKNDAWAAWHELKQLRQEVFGPHQFLELNIGGN